MKQAKIKTVKIKRQRKYMEVLPKAARDYADKCLKDPKLAREFLVATGIWTKTGKLTRNYR